MMKKALLISCFEEWYKDRLEPIIVLLNNRRYDTRCLLSDYNHISKKYSKRDNDICVYIHVPGYKRNISLQRIRSHIIFGKRVNEVINEYKPDLVYLVLPPNNIAKYCKKYKKSHPNTRLIIDIIDLWPESMPLGKLKNTLPAKIWRDWRNDAIRIADYLFTECGLYQEKLKDVIEGAKASTLYLYKEQTETESQLVMKIISEKKMDDITRLAYLGSMNSIIDIQGICRVIKYLVDSGKTCELHAIGNGESKETFERAVRGIGCETHFYGPIFDEIEKIEILAPCDYALNMMVDDVSVGLTIKSIDYLSYGLPIINNIKGDTEYFVDHNNIGINYVENNIIDCTKLASHKEIYDFYLQHFTKTAFLERFISCVWNIL